jgi:hypothetical protein
MPKAVVFLLTSVLLLVGCSNQLTRDDAKTKITKETKLFESLTEKHLLTEIGHIEAPCYRVESYDPVEGDKQLRLLSQLGMLSIQSSGKHKWDVALTEEGKKSIKGEPYAHTTNKACDYSSVDFPTAEIDRVEITGIQQEGTHAKVEATLVWKPTQLGMKLKQLREQHHSSEMDTVPILENYSFTSMPKDAVEFSDYEKFGFDRYDDGWRLKQK